MHKMLKYGMVGGGLDSLIGNVHRKAIRLENNAQLVAGCFSRDYEKTLEAGVEFRVEKERLYKNYEDMAIEEGKREDGIDFVVIVTPNYAHYEACKAFLNAGIAVACDKPLCIHVEQAYELRALAKEKNLQFLVTYTYWGNVTARQARDMITAGEIGKIRTIMGEYPQSWLAGEDISDNKQGEWRTNPDLSGDTNCLGDIGTHIENMVMNMTGLKIKRVLARMETIVPGRVLDDNTTVLLEYDNGASGVYWSSQMAIGHKNGFRVRIYGEKGSIHWFQEESEKLYLMREDGSSCEIYRGDNHMKPNAAKYVRIPSGHAEGYFEAMANLYVSFIECLVAQKEGNFTEDMIDYPTIEDGIDGVEYITACLKSSREGNVWVDMK
jgi:Predicted dehydrogenases and related proteins